MRSIQEILGSGEIRRHFPQHLYHDYLLSPTGQFLVTWQKDGMEMVILELK